jgi:uncharacterized membrane protein
MFSKFNPALIPLALGSLLTVVVALGLITLTDIQQDLILKAVVAVLAMLGIVSVPTAGAVTQKTEQAFQDGLHTPVPTQNVSAYTDYTKSY